MEDLILCEETGCCISESVVDNNWLQILAQRKFHWVMMLLLVCNNRLTDRSCILKNGQRKSMKIVKIFFAVCKVWSKFYLTFLTQPRFHLLIIPNYRPLLQICYSSPSLYFSCFVKKKLAKNGNFSKVLTFLENLHMNYPKEF